MLEFSLFCIVWLMTVVVQVTSMQVQLHVVSYRCDNESQLTRLKDIATITGGK